MDERLIELARPHLLEQQAMAETRARHCFEALEILNEPGTVPVWSISIHSAWVNMGHDGEDEKSISGAYTTDSLREAIRRAATDFCVVNGRVYPGKPRRAYNNQPDDRWREWDVQGSWYVSLLIGKVAVPIEKAMYEPHIAELRKGTDEIYGPEREALEREEVEVIP